MSTTPIRTTAELASLFEGFHLPTSRRRKMKIGRHFDPQDWDQRRARRANDVLREQFAETNALLVQAGRIADIAETLKKSGDPRHTVFAAEARRRRAQARRMKGVRI
jgi:hypothetical protein